MFLFFHYNFDLRTLINPHVKDLKDEPWDMASDEEMLPTCFWKNGPEEGAPFPSQAL